MLVRHLSGSVGFQICGCTIPRAMSSGARIKCACNVPSVTAAIVFSRPVMEVRIHLMTPGSLKTMRRNVRCPGKRGIKIVWSTATAEQSRCPGGPSGFYRNRFLKKLSIHMPTEALLIAFQRSVAAATPDSCRVGIRGGTMPNLASNFRARCEIVMSTAGRKASGAARRCGTRQMLKSSCWRTLSQRGKGLQCLLATTCSNVWRRRLVILIARTNSTNRRDVPPSQASSIIWRPSSQEREARNPRT